MTTIEKWFAHDYEFEVLSELPGAPTLPIHYFPTTKLWGGHNGELVFFRPRSGNPWIGMFAFGDSGMDALYTTPNPDQLCVISRGSAYIVNSADPTQWTALGDFITSVIRLEKENLLLLCTDWNLAALGAHGVEWKNNDLGDELVISEIASGVISGTHFHAGENIPFAISTTTGKPIIGWVGNL